MKDAKFTFPSRHIGDGIPCRAEHVRKSSFSTEPTGPDSQLLSPLPRKRPHCCAAEWRDGPEFDCCAKSLDNRYVLQSSVIEVLEQYPMW